MEKKLFKFVCLSFNKWLKHELYESNEIEHFVWLPVHTHDESYQVMFFKTVNFKSVEWAPECANNPYKKPEVLYPVYSFNDSL